MNEKMVSSTYFNCGLGGDCAPYRCINIHNVRIQCVSVEVKCTVKRTVAQLHYIGHGILSELILKKNRRSGRT